MKIALFESNYGQRKRTCSWYSNFLGCSCTNADRNQIDLSQVFTIKCTTWNQTLGNLSLRQHKVRQDNITWRVQASLSTLETTSRRQNDQRRLWQKWSPHFCMRAHVRSSIMYCHRCYASVWWWLSHPVTHRSCGKAALWDTRHLNVCPSNNEHKSRRLWLRRGLLSLCRAETEGADTHGAHKMCLLCNGCMYGTEVEALHMWFFFSFSVSDLLYKGCNPQTNA